MLQLRKRNKLIDYILIMIGTTLLAVAINVYFEGLELITGGVTGLSIIIKNFTGHIWEGGIPLSVSNLSINIPLFLIAFAIHGKDFGAKSLFSTFYLSFALEYTKFLPSLTHDLFLGSVFGGVIAGIGIGLVFVANATTGGTDMAGSLLHHFFPQFSTAKWMQAVDTIIILVGLLSFGPERAMYSIISVYITVQVIDAILEGLNFSKAAFIISDKHQEIADAIFQQIERGVTALKGIGKYTNTEKEVLLCVMSKRQILVVKNIVKQIDSKAFMIVTDAREVFGEGFIEEADSSKNQNSSKNN